MGFIKRRQSDEAISGDVVRITEGKATFTVPACRFEESELEKLGESVRVNLPSADEQIMEKARRIAGGRLHDFWRGNSDQDIREREIAVLVANYDKQKALYGHLKQGLMREECGARTEFIQREKRTATYSPNRWPERQRDLAVLRGIEDKRRNMMIIHAEKLNTIRAQIKYHIDMLHGRAVLDREAFNAQDKWTQSN